MGAETGWFGEGEVTTTGKVSRAKVYQAFQCGTQMYLPLRPGLLVCPARKFMAPLLWCHLSYAAFTLLTGQEVFLKWCSSYI